MTSNKENTRVPASSIANTAAKLASTERPYVRIVEQPRSRGLRFRYECEARRAGNILGANWCKTNKTYPTIEIVNSQGPSFVVVSCVSVEPPYRPHPHSIVGKGNEYSNGICYMKVPASQNVIVFQGMAVQCAKKTCTVEKLEERRRLKVDPFMTGYPDNVRSIDMTCVRLCFQVFLEGAQEGNFNVALKPIVTQPIYDKKSSVNFEIAWISHASASVTGGKVICILADKIVKDDIQVIFFCEKSGWERKAEFTWPFFHKQVAVVVMTPPYFDQEVTESVWVQVMLRRSSNETSSVPVPFEFIPEARTYSKDSTRAKRLRLSTTTPRCALVEQRKVKNPNRKNVSAASERVRASQAQQSVMPNQQSIKVESTLLRPPRDFSNVDTFQFPLPPPETPVEFKQILAKYMYND